MARKARKAGKLLILAPSAQTASLSQRTSMTIYVTSKPAQSDTKELSQLEFFHKYSARGRLGAADIIGSFKRACYRPVRNTVSLDAVVAPKWTATKRVGSSWTRGLPRACRPTTSWKFWLMTIEDNSKVVQQLKGQSC